MDLIRAVALLTVVSVQFLLNTGFYQEIVAGKRMYAMTLIRCACSVCVPLFMLLTGYLSAEKRVSVTHYRGLGKTLGEYVLSAVGCIAFRRFYLGESISLKFGVLSVLDFSASSYGWYVEMYIGLFLLAPFLNLIYKGLKNQKEKKYLILIVFFLSSGASVLNGFDLTTAGFWTNPAVAQYDTKLVPAWWAFLYPVLYYFLGCYIRECSVRISIKKALPLIFLAVVFFGSYNYYRSYGTTYRSGIWQDWNSLQAVFLSVLVFVLLLSLNLERVPGCIASGVRKISELSFAAYLLSACSDQFLYPYLNHAVYGMTDRLNYFPLVVGGSFVLSLLGAQIIHWIYRLLSKPLKWAQHLAVKTWKRQNRKELTGKEKALSMLCCVLAVCFLAVVYLYGSQASWALTLKKQIKYEVLHIPHDTQEAETVGMDDDWEMTLYADGEVTSDVYYNADLDNKRVYAGESRSRLVNYTDGYQMDFPADTTFDFSLSAAVIHAAGEGYEYTISREYSPYFDITEEMTTGLQKYVPDFPYEDGVDQYIGYYQSRFLLNETWQKNNSVTVSDVEVFSAGGAKAYCYHAVMEDVPGGKYDAYSYYYIRAEDRDFFRIVVKYHHENTELRQWIRDSFESFRQFTPAGSSHISTSYEPVIPDNWSDETRAVYDSIVSGETLRWGIYTDDVYGNGIDVKIPELEETLDYKFQVVLSYVHSISQFPTEFMEKNWEQGRIVELTYQLTENNNEDMFGYSPLLDLYRGINEEMIREFARAAKDFGHPFLFRFCNEMNSDWTSYGGVVNMADPELFVECYQRIYKIFQEEGVDNCIWIYNPNDRNAPPSRWNDALNYYPGNEYVQMIGVTGYNNGTYYRKWAESWREFAEIYDTLQNEYGQVFGAFPWIITEFSSSSVGGDKVSWIEDMFANIGNYPNIKIAVWFSSADYDQDGTVARPYWLDETPATLEAFQQGLQQYPVIPWEDS